MKLKTKLLKKKALAFSKADMTLTGLTALSVRCLNGARSWGLELLFRANGRQPKTVEV